MRTLFVFMLCVLIACMFGAFSALFLAILTRGHIDRETEIWAVIALVSFAALISYLFEVLHREVRRR